MAELFRFAAFISYSSADAVFARRLLNTLEHYSIPKSLGAFDLIGGGKPNRIYPICRDREEFGAGPLSERIQAALKASANLIVVCSPNSAASPWVQKEIESFIALGRRDKIYAIISDTAPVLDDNGKDATRQCFPPAFQASTHSGGAGLEPLAADARRGRDGFRNAWLKLVAGIVGLNPGQLIDRDLTRRRQQRLVIGAAVAAFSALSLLIAAAIDVRNSRSELTAYSAELVGQGLPLDAIAFALAGLPAAGDIIPVTHPGAAQALRNTGAYFPIVDEFESWTTELSPDRRYATANSPDNDHTLLYTIGGAAAPEDLGRTSSVAFSPDGRFIAIQGDDRTVRLKPLEGDQSPVRLGAAPEYAVFDFSPDGHFLLLTDASGVARLWSLETLSVVRSFGRSTGGYFSPDGRFLVMIDNQQSADLYDLRNPAAEPPLLGLIGDVVFDARSRYLAARDVDGVGLLFDLNAPDQPRVFGRVTGLEFSKDGSVLVIQNTPAATLHPVAGGGRDINLDQAYFLEVSPNARFAAVTDANGQGWLYDTASNQQPRALGHVYDRTPPDFQFSPDGRFLTFRYTDLEGMMIALGANDEDLALGPISGGGAEFSSDGRFLLVLEQSYFATVRNLQTGASISLGPVTSLGLAADDRSLITSAFEDHRDVVRDLRGWTTTRSEVCRASADQLRPFRHSVREPSDGQVSVRQMLRGRPWNPCDWRGLFAFENGWEGLAQWLRLIRIRYFNAPDYACEEIDAAGHVSPMRRRACARREVQSPQVWRPTAHP